jgi:hypothetical protein
MRPIKSRNNGWAGHETRTDEKRTGSSGKTAWRKRGRKGRIILILILLKMMGRDNVVGIATCYGLDGPGIESRWGRDFTKDGGPG